MRFGPLPPPIDTTFKITVDTTKAGSASNTFVLTLHSGTTSMTVSWGDGNSDVITAYNQAELTHVYASSGTYQISLDGSFAGVKFNNTGDKLKLASIDNWGTNAWSSMYLSFGGCSNMVANYTDNPDTSSVTTMFATFFGCSSFNGIINFSTSNVTNMQQMFHFCNNFNSSVTFSDTSNVTTMKQMFSGCGNFNNPLTFNCISVGSMNNIFDSCISFNSLPTFSNTSNVTDATRMFYNCTNFNKDVNFDLASVTTVKEMFYQASSFNKNISFNLASCTNAQSMFLNCYAFNSPITLSNTSLIATFNSTFANCTLFNQDISGFSINAVTIASNMLSGTAFSTTNYDLLLVAWQGQTHNNSVTFHAGTAKYSSGAPATARAALITDSWTITDGGAV